MCEKTLYQLKKVKSFNFKSNAIVHKRKEINNFYNKGKK